ncbi:MAG: carboxypeptidase-like regulatory domain-containing protein [Myxococcota bacterium]
MKAYDYGFLAAILLISLGTGTVILWPSAPDPSRSPSAIPLDETLFDFTPEARFLRVRGAVTDTSGSALAGVRVRPEGDLAPETLTDPLGHYELPIPLESSFGTPAVRFLADGYEDARAVLENLAGPEARADVQLERRRQRTVVSGRVTSASGEPVEGELVEFESAQLEALHTALTDRRGLFLIPEVAVGDDYELRIRARGPYQTLWQFPLRATRDGLDLELVLAPQAMPSVSADLRLHASDRR